MTILIEYSDYSNIFLAKNVTEFIEYIEINNYAIKLEKSKQRLFRPIYSLGTIELEILKIYIKIKQANSFIYSFKSLASIFILFY